jgi:hypothetical protein
MAILNTIKKGYMHLKVGGAYIKLLPRTLATLVSMSDGRSVENAIDELNRKLFLDGYFFVDFGSLPNSTTKLVDTDIPNVATHYWIVAGWAKTPGGNGSYTLPYIDPNNWNNSIRVLLNANRQIEVTTITDWSGYPAYFIVAYKL